MTIKPLYLVMATAAAVLLAPQLVSRTYAGDLNKEIPVAASDPANAGFTEVAVLADEQTGFLYHDGRDETGFVDGTANPPVRRAADVALVPLGTPGEAGSHVLAMRWVHDLDAFHRLSIHEQERVFGRTKLDSVELSHGEKPPDAHIARVELDVEGEELEIFRRSVPYGTIQESGLYFVAFSADPSRFQRMLARMFGIDGVRDRLTDFSTPASGAYYFAPSINALRALAGPEQD